MTNHTLHRVPQGPAATGWVESRSGATVPLPLPLGEGRAESPGAPGVRVSIRFRRHALSSRPYTIRWHPANRYYLGIVMKTALCHLLEIEHPILAAPMGPDLSSGFALYLGAA
jgi:hypothetical protein